MAVTNNVTRMLDSKKVKYTAFELPAEKLGAKETARRLDVAPETVFKTIVVALDKSSVREKPGKPVLAVIPGSSELDLKALAAFLGEKKVRLTTQREAEQMTGLQAGGISPLALINKGFQVVIDQSAQGFEQIHVSGGQRGLNLRLPVKDLVTLTRARFGAISAESSSESDLDYE